MMGLARVCWVKLAVEDLQWSFRRFWHFFQDIRYCCLRRSVLGHKAPLLFLLQQLGVVDLGVDSGIVQVDWLLVLVLARRPLEIRVQLIGHATEQHAVGVRKDADGDAAFDLHELLAAEGLPRMEANLDLLEGTESQAESRDS